MEIRQVIVDTLKETIEETGSKLLIEITDKAILLQTGLDSLGFAILVTKLEEILGYEPFTLMEEPYYPNTFKEFVDVYEKYRPPK